MAASPSPPPVLPRSNAPVPLPRSGSPLAPTPTTPQVPPPDGTRCLRDLPQVSSNEAIKAYASLSVRLSEMSELWLQEERERERCNVVDNTVIASYLALSYSLALDVNILKNQLCTMVHSLLFMHLL